MVSHDPESGITSDIPVSTPNPSHVISFTHCAVDFSREPWSRKVFTTDSLQRSVIIQAIQESIVEDLHFVFQAVRCYQVCPITLVNLTKEILLPEILEALTQNQPFSSVAQC